MNVNKEPSDLETLAREGRTPPHHGPYRIRVNGALHVVTEPMITVEEVIALAGKNPPEQFAVFQRKHGHPDPKPIPPGTVIDLREPGIEQFVVLPRVQNDGFENLRRLFELPPRDVRTLDELGLRWETVIEQGVCRLVIYEFPVGNGYQTVVADLNLRIEAGYPDTPLDMAYFHPPLARADGRAIQATSADSLDGRDWQRWSRHRSESDKWIPGVDDIATHLACIRLWLAREVTR